MIHGTTSCIITYRSHKLHKTVSVPPDSCMRNGYLSRAAAVETGLGSFIRIFMFLQCSLFVTVCMNSRHSVVFRSLRNRTSYCGLEVVDSSSTCCNSLNDYRQVVHTHTCDSVSIIYIDQSGKVTVGLALHWLCITGLALYSPRG